MSQHAGVDQVADSCAPKGTILQLLLDSIQDSNPRMRALTVRQLTGYASLAVVERIMELADHDPDFQVRCAAISAIGSILDDSTITDVDLIVDEAKTAAPNQAQVNWRRVRDFLLDVIADPGRTLDERRYAIESLSHLNNEQVERLIAELYARPEKTSKMSALLAMGYNGAARWEETLRHEFSNPDPDLCVEAVLAAGELGLPSMGKDLWRLTYSENKDVMLSAVWALGQTGWDGAFERLDELTLHDDLRVRESADEAMDEWLFYNGLASELEQDQTERFLDEE